MLALVAFGEALLDGEERLLPARGGGRYAGCTPGVPARVVHSPIV